MCLSFNGAYEDYPFDDFNWTVMRHKENKKTFAFICEYKGQMRMSVKALPELGALWRQQYPSVVEAYHLNKMHWISILLDDSLSDDIIYGLVKDSFELTLPKVKNAKRN